MDINQAIKNVSNLISSKEMMLKQTLLDCKFATGENLVIERATVAFLKTSIIELHTIIKDLQDVKNSCDEHI